jgi:hypothetical protein
MDERAFLYFYPTDLVLLRIFSYKFLKWQGAVQPATGIIAVLCPIWGKSNDFSNVMHVSSPPFAIDGMVKKLRTASCRLFSP